ncbi:hypothetical protein, partial [Rhizobium laguerreae]
MRLALDGKDACEFEEAFQKMRSRDFVLLMVSLVTSSLVHAAGTREVTREPASRPVALVYRGPAACDGCPGAIAEVLARSPWRFRVIYVGPAEKLKISPAALSHAALYV